MNLHAGKLFQKDEDHEEVLAKRRKFGDLKTSPFSYLTPKMIGMVLFVSAAIIMNFEAVKHNFTAGHVALNGLIVGVFLLGVIQTAVDNIKLMYVARFLVDVDRLMDIGKTTKGQYLALQKRLEERVSLINLKTTFKLIDNLYEYGNMLIKDKDAIMIKSKLGYRMRTARNNTGFLTGILVMFGLIGTFWGLLETIGAVASALNDIASASSGTQSAETMDMGGILSAISGPLKGMGLAFSASLFGLSGSLMLGFFSHLAGDAQNQIIEDISRWIDDRISTPAAAAIEKGKELKTVGLKENSDLEAWLASYAYLSSRTDKNLASLFESLTELFSRFDSLSLAVKSLDQVQNKTNTMLEVNHKEQAVLQGQYQKIIDNLSPLPSTMTRLEGVMTGTQDAVVRTLGYSEELGKNVSGAMEASAKAIANLADSADRSGQREERQLENSYAILAGLKEQQGLLLGFHTGLTEQLKNLGFTWANTKEGYASAQKSFEGNVASQTRIAELSLENSKQIESVLKDIGQSLDRAVVELGAMGGVMKGQNDDLVQQVGRVSRQVDGSLRKIHSKIDAIQAEEFSKLAPRKQNRLMRFLKRDID